LSDQVQLVAFDEVQLAVNEVLAVPLTGLTATLHVGAGLMVKPVEHVPVPSLLVTCTLKVCAPTG
jgi:hypothetical protein